MQHTLIMCVTLLLAVGEREKGRTECVREIKIREEEREGDKGGWGGCLKLQHESKG
jgi:hypothetical protein